MDADLADVRLDGHCSCTIPERLDCLDYLIGTTLAVGIVDDYATATFGQLDCYAFADAAAGASDDGDFAMEGGGGYQHWLLRHAHDGCSVFLCIYISMRFSIYYNSLTIISSDPS